MKKLSVLLLLLFTAGCVSVSEQRFNKDVVYPQTSSSAVEVLAVKPAESNFVELAEITVTGASDWLQIKRIFREKAGEMGADAVYVLSQGEESKPNISDEECYPRNGYYYPYHHFGWKNFPDNHYYPRGYYYCYGYQEPEEAATFLSAVGIAIKYNGA